MTPIPKGTDVNTPILIAGAGPIGLILAYTLAHRYSIPCTIIDRYAGPTKWPKMDLTNSRTMEILHMVDPTLVEELRREGVDGKWRFDVLFATGLGEEGECLAKWDLDSADEWRERIGRENDGRWTREPWLRIQQSILERVLRGRCQRHPLITFLAPVNVDYTVCHPATQEKGSYCTTTLSSANGVSTITSIYVIASDGAGSTLRATSTRIRSRRLPPAPPVSLVHFRSHDPTMLKYGRFWHIFLTHRGICIAQDESDTYTVHLFHPPPNVDETEDIGFLPAEEVVRRVLKADVKIDEILVRSVWKPNFAVADHYSEYNIFLLGDAAHQWAPLGGYGFNTGVGDAFDLAWKLAYTIRCHAGPMLLESYETERLQVARMCLERSWRHMEVHLKAWEMADRGEREGVGAWYTAERGENEDLGVEYGCRYRDSPVISYTAQGETREERAEVEDEWAWTPEAVRPSTRPGCRAPHVFKKDGKTSVLDELGTGFTLVTFTSEETTDLARSASARGFDVSILSLEDEPHVRGIWGNDIKLIRPDGYVAWSGPTVPSVSECEKIWDRVLGWTEDERVDRDAERSRWGDEVVKASELDNGFN
ncbi:hypothetical protein YB2330_004468 [Saitoella coloradoensis]